jgi:UbiD family decarboxylase
MVEQKIHMSPAPSIVDLRTTLSDLAAQGEAFHVCEHELDPNGPVIRDYVERNRDIRSSVYCSDQPLVLYRRCGRSDFPILLGVFGARHRNHMYLDPLGKVPQASCGTLLRNALANPLPPLLGPSVHDRQWIRQPDLLATLPALRLSPRDPAPSITLGLVYATDPASGQSNCSFHRICLWPDGAITLWIAPNRHLDELRKRAAARGEKLPISVNIGLAPSVYLAACCTEPDIGFGTDELAVAGSLLEAPVGTAACLTSSARYIDHAEIVIEGSIGVETRRESADEKSNWSIPEYLGYRREAGIASVMHVDALGFRHGAMYQTLCGPGKEQSEMLGIAQEVTVLGLLLQGGFSVVHDVYCCASGGGNLTVILQVDKKEKDDDQSARSAACAVAEGIKCVKHVFIVDMDVNIFSQADLMWAMTTRFRADADLIQLGPMPGTAFDPTQHAGYADGLKAGSIVKCVFDSSAPFALRSRFARAFSVSEEWM